MRYFAILLILLSLAACQAEQSSPESTMSVDETTSLDQLDEPPSLNEDTPPPPPQGTPSKQVAPQKVTRKLIKEGNLRFETSDLAQTRKRVDQAIKRFDAYLAEDQSYTHSYQIQQSLLIRVPAAHFGSLVEAISVGVGTFDQKEVKVKDVTAQYIDITARLKTRKALEARYVGLLAQAKTVKEILEIERQIGEVREAIESMEGRLRYLKDQVAYSSLHLSFYETTSHSKKPGFGSRLADGFAGGWDGFKSFLVGIVAVWPLWIILALLFWGIRAVRREDEEVKEAPIFLSFWILHR